MTGGSGLAKSANNYNIIKETSLFDDASTIMGTIRPAFENLAAAAAADLTGLANLTSLQQTNRTEIFQIKAELAESKIDLAHGFSLNPCHTSPPFRIKQDVHQDAASSTTRLGVSNTQEPEKRKE